MSREALTEAIKIAGSQCELAKRVRQNMPGSKVQQAHISKWLLRTKAAVPPGDYVLAISRSVDWAVTPHRLRRDLYPNPMDGLPADCPDGQHQKEAA